MAVNQAVWSIDIGMAALKAMCLRYAEGSDQVVAVAFDYIEHPKILSQPDADADALIRDALRQFLGRNEVSGDLVALAVPGQAGLVRFVKLPPVEPSRMGEIVRYEARQQIPFALEEVIWDYQQMGGAGEIEGFALDAEVGIFAMKRDQVLRQLNPLSEAGVEADLIQMTPVALYNCMVYDRISRNGEPEEEQGDREFIVLLDVGADNTNLVVTDGDKVWQRNVPIGGNHFTRSLTKQLKLTFAKAEHIKRNATKTKDPRAVFQAMRPVFNDFMTEVQRSIGYFASVNRNSRIGKIIGMGGGFKLPGLQKFLSQNLQYPVEKLSGFPTLAGDAVLTSPAFKEHIMSFPVCYGLGLQCLEQTKIRTSLLPPEIVQERLVRAKKPWAMAAAALVLLGSTIGFAGWVPAYKNTHKARFEKPEAAANALTDTAKKYETDYNTENQKLQAAQKSAKEMVAGVNQRDALARVLKHLNEITPRETDDSKALNERDEITIPVVDVEFRQDLSTWALGLSEDAKKHWTEQEKTTPLAGEGYLITLEGYHFHNNFKDPGNSYIDYVQNTFLKTLTNPQSRQLGISHTAILGSTTEKLGAGQRSRRGAAPKLGGIGNRVPQTQSSEDDAASNAEYTAFTIQLVFQPPGAGAGDASSAPAQGPKAGLSDVSAGGGR